MYHYYMVKSLSRYRTWYFIRKPLIGILLTSFLSGTIFPDTSSGLQAPLKTPQFEFRQRAGIVLDRYWLAERMAELESGRTATDVIDEGIINLGLLFFKKTFAFDDLTSLGVEIAFRKNGSDVPKKDLGEAIAGLTREKAITEINSRIDEILIFMQDRNIILRYFDPSVQRPLDAPPGTVSVPEWTKKMSFKLKRELRYTQELATSMENARTPAREENSTSFKEISDAELLGTDISKLSGATRRAFLAEFVARYNRVCSDIKRTFSENDHDSTVYKELVRRLYEILSPFEDFAKSARHELTNDDINFLIDEYTGMTSSITYLSFGYV